MFQFQWPSGLLLLYRETNILGDLDLGKNWSWGVRAILRKQGSAKEDSKKTRGKTDCSLGSKLSIRARLPWSHSIGADCQLAPTRGKPRQLHEAVKTSDCVQAPGAGRRWEPHPRSVGSGLTSRLSFVGSGAPRGPGQVHCERLGRRLQAGAWGS